jgi:hypothetical protein
MENSLVIAATRLQKKIHRLDQSILFIESCIENRKIPSFAAMGKQVRNKLTKSKLNYWEIFELEIKSLCGEVKNHRESILNLQSEINTTFEKLKTYLKIHLNLKALK